VPTGPLAVHFCAQFAGATLRQYSTDARVLAESVVRYYERFRPNAGWLSADTWVSAEAMGARVGSVDEHQPLGGWGGPWVRSARDIDRLPSPDPSTQGRYPILLEALQRIVQALGRDVFVVACFDQYPFSLAAALLGVNEIMLNVVEDRPLVEALMERCLEFSVAYARALDRAGPDLLSGGDSPAALLGPRLYREVAWPFERRVIRALKASTATPVSLHICGDALPFLPDMALSGADVLEIDHKVDLRRACEIVGPAVALWGNLDPVAVLAQGPPEQVRAQAQAAVAAARAARHSRFVLSSGCTLAVETPVENLDALLRAVD
jgi:MtaA/CmuA family methyltransferase